MGGHAFHPCSHAYVYICVHRHVCCLRTRDACCSFHAFPTIHDARARCRSGSRSGSRSMSFRSVFIRGESSSHHTNTIHQPLTSLLHDQNQHDHHMTMHANQPRRPLRTSRDAYVYIRYCTDVVSLGVVIRDIYSLSPSPCLVVPCLVCLVSRASRVATRLLVSTSPSTVFGARALPMHHHLRSRSIDISFARV